MENKSIIDPHYPYTYRRTLCAAKRLVCRYKGIIRAGETGSSEQGRNILSLILGKGNRKILLLGSIHGREYVTAGYLLKCAEKYAQHFQRGENMGEFDLRNILCNFSFYIVPLSNPDSVEIALGRAYPQTKEEDFCAYTYKNNGRNVNLNANFPFCFEEVPQNRQGGKCAASEAETRFIINLCEKHSFEKALSFHIRGGCVFWRDSKNGEIEGDTLLAQNLQRLCGLKSCKETKSPQDYSGGFENWFRYRFSRPAVCVELVDDEKAPFDLVCRGFERYTCWERTKFVPLAATDCNF